MSINEHRLYHLIIRAEILKYYKSLNKCKPVHIKSITKVFAQWTIIRLNDVMITYPRRYQNYVIKCNHGSHHLDAKTMS